MSNTPSRLLERDKPILIALAQDLEIRAAMAFIKDKIRRNAVIFCGPSGVGKGLNGTLFAELLETFGIPVQYLEKATTRELNDHEIATNAYKRFESVAAFDAAEEAGKILESDSYEGNRYGTLSEPFIRAMERGSVVCGDISIKGVQAIRQSDLKVCGRKIADALFAVFLFPPYAPDSEEFDQVLRGRMESRMLLEGRHMTPESMQGRIEKAKKEVAQARLLALKPSTDPFDEKIVAEEGKQLIIVRQTFRAWVKSQVA